MVFWCYSCNSSFDDWMIPRECPICGSKNFDEAHRCDICGEPIPPTVSLCHIHEEEVKNIARAWMEDLKSRGYNTDEYLWYVQEELNDL